MKTFFLFFLLLNFAFPAFAQDIPIGNWRTHTAYTSAQTLAIGDNQVYAASPTSFFSYDQEFNNTTPFSKLDGFTSTDISRLAYHETSNTLLITYQNGLVTLLRDNAFFSVDALARSTRISDKQINHIYLHKNWAYLSTNFGVVVLDILKKEIKETFQNLGPNGEMIAIHASTIANDTIFLASSTGVLTAPLSGVNLLDYRNWNWFGQTSGLPQQKAQAIASLNGRVYAGIAGEGLYIYLNGLWQKQLSLPVTQINSINVSANKLIISSPQQLFISNGADSFQSLIHPVIQSPQEATFDTEGALWIADAANGLLHQRAGDFRIIAPNGPSSNTIWGLYKFQQNIVALPGGYNDAFTGLNRSGAFYLFTPTGWLNYYPAASQPAHRIPALEDLVTATYNPVDNQLYVGSFGDGLLVVNPDETFEVLNSSNSPLQPTAEGEINISGLATDSEGNTWIASYGTPVTQPSLYVKKKDNTWQSYLSNSTEAHYPLSLFIDDINYKWLLINPSRGGGIWVFEEKESKNRYLTTTLGQGGLPSNHVNSIAQDKEGQIWVGTDRGVAVFVNPVAVFANEPFDAITPIFENRPLLRNEIITSITVDGGNRKWIGTTNGLWLFNELGDKLIHHFTTENSPLPSAHIVDVQIQDNTGEVFVATDKGMVSYRGTATQGGETHATVKVFPNPVKPDFDGLVGISGLITDAIVKITDISGRLVHETRAQGGTAVWNVKDYTGRRASTGIYLIFSANEEGQETLVSKIAVIE